MRFQNQRGFEARLSDTEARWEKTLRKKKKVKRKSMVWCLGEKFKSQKTWGDQIVETGMNSVWVHVWTVIACGCMCVTLTWPSGKVGRQESQSVSSQAFSPQISSRYYCHQPLAWQILLFHFAFLYLSALLFLFSSLFSFTKTSLLLFSLPTITALHT